jgi:hypothetical protein
LVWLGLLRLVLFYLVVFGLFVGGRGCFFCFVGWGVGWGGLALNRKRATQIFCQGICYVDCLLACLFVGFVLFACLFVCLFVCLFAKVSGRQHCPAASAAAIEHSLVPFKAGLCFS